MDEGKGGAMVEIEGREIEGREIEGREQCPRCGSSMVRYECDACGGDGFDGHECGEDSCACSMPIDNVQCDRCGGDGGWFLCLSSPEWCEANPLLGREEIGRP